MADLQKEIEKLKHQLDQNAISSAPAVDRQAKSMEIMARTLLLVVEHLTSTGKSEEETRIGYILGGSSHS